MDVRDRCVGDRHYPSGETAQLVNGVLHRCRHCPAEFVLENGAQASVEEGS